MKPTTLLLKFFLLMLASAPVLAGQQLTRAEEVEALRRQKTAASRPDKGSRVEAAMLWMQERKIQEKLETPGAGYKGFRPRLGGLSTGSGFGFGVQFDRLGVIRNQMDFSFLAAGSLREYQLYQTKLRQAAYSL